MKVNVISESAFTVQGHGVHTAYTETIDALKQYTDYEVLANSDQPSEVVHIHTVGPYSLKKLWRARGARVVSAHVTPDSFVGSLIGAKYWHGLAKAYLRWFYNQADVVLAVSSEVVTELKAMGVRSTVVLLPNTIDTTVFKVTAAERAAARERLGIAADAFVVLGNGQVQPRKRIDCFVEAARSLPELNFIWVGGIPFKQLAAASGDMAAVMQDHPDNLSFPGLLERPAVIDYYRVADLFFLPSNQETFGIVIVEAAAAGLPVLLRDLPQYRVTFGETYEKGDDEMFAGLIRKFATDRAYYAHWQTAARQIAELYDAKVGAEMLVKAYRVAIEVRTMAAQSKTRA